MEKKIVKRSGAVVNFQKDILQRSLQRAGAEKKLAEEVAKNIEEEMQDGDSTAMIYKKAFKMLYDRESNVAIKYSLKKALFSLGPTGFPFEKYIAELFKRKGYSTTTNVHLRGTCISHEVDVLAIGSERVAMEVKFHNDMHIRSDVKAVLYAKARFDDLVGRTGKILRIKKGAVDRCLLVTNTKFTKNAIAYAECAGVELLGWGYPHKKNLQTYIKETDAHPITCLASLGKSTARELFDSGIVTCRGLLERVEEFKRIKNADLIISEAKALCSKPIKNL